MRHISARPAFAGNTLLQPANTKRTRSASRILVGFALLASFSVAASAQDVFKPPAPVTYTEKYEIYGGASFLNGQAGQNLPKRINMGGGEVMATYFITPRIGPAVDFRFEWGTAPVFPNSFSIPTRPVAYQTIGMLGLQYHAFGNQHFGINYHAFGGVSAGKFDSDLKGIPPAAVGLYTNRVKPMAALGGSLDINRSAHVAIRLSPDLILEHFGTETRQFFSISGGVIYRFGHR